MCTLNNLCSIFGCTAEVTVSVHREAFENKESEAAYMKTVAVECGKRSSRLRVLVKSGDYPMLSLLQMHEEQTRR